ncbi:hypothetical protein TcWFU_008166 [Taenia crassiceps]|uniref:Secreted protein n=1 Tax=Taenia crassiceps TaxID=6207 RepID=A0ABR4QSD2_9CEST
MTILLLIIVFSLRSIKGLTAVPNAHHSSQGCNSFAPTIFKVNENGSSDNRPTHTGAGKPHESTLKVLEINPSGIRAL